MIAALRILIVRSKWTCPTPCRASPLVAWRKLRRDPGFDEPTKQPATNQTQESSQESKKDGNDEEATMKTGLHRKKWKEIGRWVFGEFWSVAIPENGQISLKLDRPPTCRICCDLTFLLKLFDLFVSPTKAEGTLDHQQFQWGEVPSPSLLFVAVVFSEVSCFNVIWHSSGQQVLVFAEEFSIQNLFPFRHSNQKNTKNS